MDKRTIKGTPKKEAQITDLIEKIGKSKSIVLAEYRGIKHKQLEELRRSLRKVDGEFMVAKNRLFKKALGDTGAAMESQLEEQNATLFAYGDEVAPLKELLKFFKAVGMGSTKGGLLGKTVLTQDEVKKLSTLPNKEVLLSTLVRQLNSPIQGLHYALQWNINKLAWALNAIKGKKTN